MSNAVQQTGNRVPQILRFAKKGQILVNCASAATTRHKTYGLGKLPPFESQEDLLPYDSLLNAL